MREQWRGCEKQGSQAGGADEQEHQEQEKEDDWWWGLEASGGNVDGSDCARVCLRSLVVRTSRT